MNVSDKRKNRAIEPKTDIAHAKKIIRERKKNQTGKFEIKQKKKQIKAKKTKPTKRSK